MPETETAMMVASPEGVAIALSRMREEFGEPTDDFSWEVRIRPGRQGHLELRYFDFTRTPPTVANCGLPNAMVTRVRQNLLEAVVSDAVRSLRRAVERGRA